MLTIVDNPKLVQGRRRIVSSCVAETIIMTAEGYLVFTAELGHGLCQHGHLAGVILPDEILFPLTPGLRLKFLRCLFFVHFDDHGALLGHEVVMDVTILQRLLLVFLRLAKARRVGHSDPIGVC